MIKKSLLLLGIALVLGAVVSCKSGPRVEAFSAHFPSGYVIELTVSDPRQTISSVEVTGPEIEGSLSLVQTRPGRWWSQPNVELGPNPPSLPLVYTFNLTDKEGVNHVVQDEVQNYVEEFAAPISPTGNVASADGLVFFWTTVNIPDIYYQVQLNDESFRTIWDSHTTTGTSLTYEGPTLGPGNYQYFISTTLSKSGDQSLAHGSFTVGPAGQMKGTTTDTTGAKLLDYSFARPDPAYIKSQGFEGVIRYLSPDPSSKKVLTVQERDALRAAGLAIGLVWESYAMRGKEGYEAGVQDGRAALSQASNLGFPDHLPVYFAIDWDATAEEQSNINEYFHGVRSVFGSRKVGAYGGYYVIKRLFDVSKIDYGWQTYAWSDGLWDNRAQLRQILNDQWNGQVDFDESTTGDWGGWQP